MRVCGVELTASPSKKGSKKGNGRDEPHFFLLVSLLPFACFALVLNKQPTQALTAERRIHCQRLSREFQHYIASCGLLRKVFLSVKGIYYQAIIRNKYEITWIVPQNFAHSVESCVALRSGLSSDEYLFGGWFCLSLSLSLPLSLVLYWFSLLLLQRRPPFSVGKRVSPFCPLSFNTQKTKHRNQPVNP